MTPRLLPLLCCLWLPAQALYAASPADTAWASVTALDHAPSKSATSREEARTAGLAHLQRQETALRNFISQHPADPRVVDAKLRLAHLSTVRADFMEHPNSSTAMSILDDLARTAPDSRKADVAFARISLSMRGITIPTDNDRRTLSDAIHRFQRAYPNDRRIAPLLTELASLYDHLPKEKERYLMHALRAARDEGMKARIHDDLRRLSLLGKPLLFSGTGPDGRPVSTENYRGKIVLIYFAAGWSPPSLGGIEEVNYLRNAFPANRVAVIGVSLDPTAETFAATAAQATGSWTWIHEKEGWDSPSIRRLGINALPLLWILDPQGRLRTLNARTESETLIRALIRENP